MILTSRHRRIERVCYTMREYAFFPLRNSKYLRVARERAISLEAIRPSMPPTDQRPTVYTTGIGRIPLCKRCRLPQTQCHCQASHAPDNVPRDGFVRIARDRKGRAGKTMTVVHGVADDAATLADVSQQLKRLCGAGGAVKDLEIQIQGDHRDKIEAWLVQHGYKVKRVGG